MADDHDKRVQHLKLTEHALPVIEQLGGIKRKIDQEILEGIPEEDIANMANTMEKILRNLKNGQKGRSHHYETENVKRGGSGEGADRTLVIRTGSASIISQVSMHFIIWWTGCISDIFRERVRQHLPDLVYVFRLL